ncbi:hypothetical protein Tco_1502678 [Tanacetum coccineum]
MHGLADSRNELAMLKCLNGPLSIKENFGSCFWRAWYYGMLRDLNFPLLQELSNKKDASTWDIMDLLRLDDAVAETLGMTDLQPDVSQLMVLVHHKQDRVVIGSQALSVALDICRGRVEKIERNLIEHLPFLKDVFVSIDDPLSAEALIEPSTEVPATNVLSTVVIVPPTDPSVSVEDYDNPDSADVVPENATLGSKSEGKIDASAGGGLAFSQLDDEARMPFYECICFSPAVACDLAVSFVIKIQWLLIVHPVMVYTAAVCGLFVAVFFM